MSKKYCIYKRPWGDIEAWEYIDDLDKAMSYWYIRVSLDKYGVEGTMPICMNAANEEAVLAFLDGRIKLYSIIDIVEKMLESHNHVTAPTLDEIFEIDKETRIKTQELFLKY